MGGGGSTYDYGFRIYNPSIAKFLSVDPLASSFPWNSPYSFAEGDPINFIDLDGLEKAKPDVATGAGFIKMTSAERTAAFTARHPIAATAIGLPTKGSYNISTKSVRFSTRIGLVENAAHEGSQVNGFRHVLWQATITRYYGSNIASELGNAHEENPFAINGSNLKYSFTTLSKADETIDLLNNKIGRAIGLANPNANMKELALKTLEYYKENGIWSATEVKNEDGKITGYQVSQNKLSQEQYDNAKKIIDGLDSNGYTPEEAKAEKQKATELLQNDTGITK